MDDERDLQAEDQPMMDEPEAQQQPSEQEDGDQHVPYERFREVNKQKQEAVRKAREAERQTQALMQRLDELENRDQSEIDKTRSKLTRAEKERDELEARLTRVERQTWIRDAARDAKFDDPADAVAFIDVSDVTDFEDAIDQVKSLAKRKPRLLRNESPPAQIGQQVKDGQRTRKPQERVQDDMDAESSDFLQQLKQATSNAGWESVPFGDR